ncbi:MAG TPA: glucoamylase family protein [Anaerolineae bacterium]|nr:glucoamylase family protein [Anaerolineae bacterium]
MNSGARSVSTDSETRPATLSPLQQLAVTLAESHGVSVHPPHRPMLLERLPDLEVLLQQAHQRFASEGPKASSYGAEWLLDNYYLVQQAVRDIRSDMPDSYYRQLPKLETTSLAGYARAYAVASTIVSHSDSRLDLGRLTRFLQAYQSIAPLTIGELWALPTMLRFSILERLAQAVSRVAGIEISGAEQLMGSPSTGSPTDLSTGTTTANSIAGLRMVAGVDWKSFFERVSWVEQVLRGDPARVYSRMDYETRDRYRHEVEDLAKGARRSEEEVAREAIRLSQEARSNKTTSPRTHHVGFYLLDAGRLELELDLGYRAPWRSRPRRWLVRHPTPVYLSCIALFTLLLMAALAGYARYSGGSASLVISTGVLLALPSLMVAVNLINWVLTHWLPPRFLPKLGFERGLPADCRTMVVVPALLSGTSDVESLLQQLELHYLGNQDPHLYFALLTDFADAPHQHMPGDDALVERATAGIQELNRKYSADSAGPFYLFHRERRWNSREECWMGWERKRGKLMDFNRLLRGASPTGYVAQEGELAVLSGVRYVITLDEDTSLPRDAAVKLVGALNHPLNQAEFDTQSNTVVSGYTILQPRVQISPVSANRSLFARLFAGDAGVDLYTRAQSDVYQDLFGEGIYVGKGIYDVDAFQRSVAGRVPENTILSHDLLEGILGRAGLVTDITLLEDYPPDYLSYAHRSHRWMRGDWQLLPWLLPQAPTASGEGVPNYLSALDRWLILDNMRRSLRSPALIALLLSAWLWLPGSALAWTMVAVAMSASELFTATVTELARRVPPTSVRRSIQIIRQDAARWLLQLSFLPYTAELAVDAILSTLVRVTVTQRHLLQWITSAHTIPFLGRERKVSIVWREMYGAPVFAAIAILLVALTRPTALVVAAPLVIAWLASPAIAQWTSHPIVRVEHPLSAHQRQDLRRLALLTWHYFEVFVGPDDNWLPPDHFQEDPRGLVAHRTSPTNLGLMLLSTLAAYDLGYVGATNLARRLGYAFESMAKLPRHRGHFLNWYDTHTLGPLSPRYVSTVDSGNLAACLIALSQGLLSIVRLPFLRWNRWEGLRDALAALGDSLESIAGAPCAPAMAQCRDRLDHILRQILAAKNAPESWPALLAKIDSEEWPDLERQLQEALEAGPEPQDVEAWRRLRTWVHRARHYLLDARRDLDLLLPWLSALEHAPALLEHSGTESETARAWQALERSLIRNPRLDQIPQVCEAARGRLSQLQELLARGVGTSDALTEAHGWCDQLATHLDSAQQAARDLLDDYDKLSSQAEVYFQAMQFGFLYHPQRRLLRIGYNVTAGRPDPNYYDLLASEARIASLVAIAKGDIPQSHWVQLARPYALVNGAQVLLSWGGSMFEYLMPALLMRSHDGTFLQQSAYGAILRQIAYGKEKGVPWGISESAYHALNANMAYQYGPFGVPGLGLRRGLDADLVIAPYASLLALTREPREVIRNLSRFAKLGMVGLYGFYEAIDFTPSRLPEGQNSAIVRSYYAHHHGMSLLAMANYLHSDEMIRRFHADQRIQSVELLLEEKIPSQEPSESLLTPAIRPVRQVEHRITSRPWSPPIGGPVPRVHLISNGRYRVLLSSTGSGYSRWQDLDLTRWAADATLDGWGTWVYIQDRDSGAFWSATRQPLGSPARDEEVVFYTHRAEFRRRDSNIATEMDITVPPGDDVEIRRITLFNHSARRRRLAITSYGEPVLAPQAEDRGHPAFNKLFIESEYLPDLNALLFRRRQRSPQEESIYLAHVALARTGQTTATTHESDRRRFLGRGRTPRDAVVPPQSEYAPSGTTGATLDPIFSLGLEMELAEYGRGEVAYLTLAARSREDAIALIERYQDWSRLELAFDQAQSQSEQELRHLDLMPEHLERFEQLLSALLYPHAALRADPALLAANTKGQTALWPYAISGDHPILLLRLESEGGLALVREVLRAHAYWRRQQIDIDLVILNQKDSGYDQPLHGQLRSLITTLGQDSSLNQRGGIFILFAEQMSQQDLVLIETAARVTLDGEKGSLSQQLKEVPTKPSRLPPLFPTLPKPEDVEATSPLPRPTGLLFDNGLGGFTADGREYVIYLEPSQMTPTPWVNVVANPSFGFLVSEAGSGFTWSENSGENRLTPWRNDPVGDVPGEALYLRDEETGLMWSPTPLPAGAPSPYLIRHGAGYSVFEHRSHGLQQRLRLFVAPEAPVKIAHLRLENLWKRNRRLTATFYAEWVLGTFHEVTHQYIIPEYDEESQALLARNPYNEPYGSRVAFVAANQSPHGLTADRAEFLGCQGTLSRPEALGRVGLASAIQAGLDPCAALQLHIDLAPGQAKDIFFLLGQGGDHADAVRLAKRYRDPTEVEAAWEATHRFWDDLLGTVTVETPDLAMNVLLNRWLLYQTLSCHLWARSALYQSSGAFGFRDQLQNVMALVLAAPELARAHILEAARRQFEAGDVLHWWHPPSGKGVRTRISDNLLWLPFVTAHYVTTTGDIAILEERLPFLDGEPLEPGEQERYGSYESTDTAHTLYEHCHRALLKGTTAGRHGLPLIGTGDWDDGLNRVGIAGRGESIWLGWFLYATLTAFAPLCRRAGDERRASAYLSQAQQLSQALETSGWDGDWYLRAYYDDGTPLGTSQAAEYQISAIAQAWAVLSGGAQPARARQAMEAVAARLVDSESQLMTLFAPPFDRTLDDPGYIRGYPPGVRENGGQYTHGALWAIWAFAKLGQGDRAQRLFEMLNPIHHAASPEQVARYMVEPYVVAADVYSVAPHKGHGGWTWYTGSASWMYRVGLEAILGLQRSGASFQISPCIPRDWPGYRINYRDGGTLYRISVRNPQGVNQGVKNVMLDGDVLPGLEIPLLGDGKAHEVQVEMG